MKLRLPPHCYIALYSRSSLARVGVTVVGGVVDKDFRGEIRAILRNSNGEPVSFKKGDKICQGIFDFSPKKILNLFPANIPYLFWIYDRHLFPSNQLEVA